MKARGACGTKRHGLRLLAGFLLFCLAAAGTAGAGDLVYASGFERPAQERGGSNYLWYRVAACDREPYGVLASYHLPVPGGATTVRTLARQQLAAMRAAGQRRLSLGVHFYHGAGNGTLVDAADPAAVAQAATNLGDLLADVKAAGFVEVLFRFFPVDAINPSQANFNPALLDAYWHLVTALRPVLHAADLAYRIDLMVEGAPRDSNLPVPDPWKYPANRQWSDAVRDLWQRYVAAYGKADTVGFSFLTDADPARLRWRVRHMRFVYGGNYPYLFAADIYGTPHASETDRFVALDDAMRREDPNGVLGWRDSGWIIAEGYYDDPLAAANLSSAIASTQRKVFYLTQWPWDRADPACGPAPEVNVAPPEAWVVYGGYGF